MRYFIAYHLQGAEGEAVDALRQSIASRFDVQAAMKIPPHVTLFNPFETDADSRATVGHPAHGAAALCAAVRRGNAASRRGSGRRLRPVRRRAEVRLRRRSGVAGIRCLQEVLPRAIRKRKTAVAMTAVFFISRRMPSWRSRGTAGGRRGTCDRSPRIVRPPRTSPRALGRFRRCSRRNG